LRQHVPLRRLGRGPEKQHATRDTPAALSS
jgi:hypothetical protein